MSNLKGSTDNELAVCVSCSGSGKVRANTHTDTSYTFSKESCRSCKGSGVNPELTQVQASRLIAAGILIQEVG